MHYLCFIKSFSSLPAMLEFKRVTYRHQPSRLIFHHLSVPAEQCRASEASRAFTLHYNAKHSRTQANLQSLLSSVSYCSSSWLLLKSKHNQLFCLAGISFLSPAIAPVHFSVLSWLLKFILLINSLQPWSMMDALGRMGYIVLTLKWFVKMNCAY